MTERAADNQRLRGRHADGKRDRAFIELAYGAGMRASELCSVRLRDLDAANGIVYVRGKGRQRGKRPYHRCRPPPHR
ncbi:MAG: tyrosine-type recombinase/integrase [Cloacibacillus evryensis]